MADARISLEEVEKVARLARLSLQPEQAEQMRSDLNAILQYVALLDEVDTSEVEPTAHALSERSSLRPDAVVPSLDREEVLKQAPSSRDGGFAVPKVLEVDG